MAGKPTSSPSPRQLALSGGISWYGCGWRLFRPFAGLWCVLGICFFAVAIIFSIIPRVGAHVFTLVVPLFAAGFYQGAENVRAGTPLRIGALFQAFGDPETRLPLLGLGVLFLLLTAGGEVAALWLADAPLLSAAMGGSTTSGASTAIWQGLLHEGGVVTFALLLLLHIVIVMGMFFAIPLTAFDGFGPLQAVVGSFRAAMTNILPFLLFFIIYIILLFVGAIPFFLGWIVVIPFVFCSVYCAYREVFQ